jgi:hypothetical protein
MTDTTRTTIAETIRRTLPRMTPTERKKASRNSQAVD